MRLLVLTARPDLAVNRRFEEAASALGVALETIDGTAAAAVAASGSLSVAGNPKLRPLPDGVIARIGNWRPDSMLAILESLAGQGVATANSPTAIRLGRDHWATIRTLAEAGLPVPETVAGADPDLLALCPLRVSLYERGGRTAVVFARPTVVAQGSPGAAIAAEVEQGLEEQVLGADANLLQLVRQDVRLDAGVNQETNLWVALMERENQIITVHAGQADIQDDQVGMLTFEYIPDNAIVFADESHVSVPQIGGMYRGDYRRKFTLAEHGFRLPSALDNRPLTFGEFLDVIPPAIFVSATPGDYELRVSSKVVEQIVRPTGLVDPEAIIRPTSATTANVELLTPEEGVSPGQACVFYETGGTRVLGGGWIWRGY